MNECPCHAFFGQFRLETDGLSLVSAYPPGKDPEREGGVLHSQTVQELLFARESPVVCIHQPAHNPVVKGAFAVFVRCKVHSLQLGEDRIGIHRSFVQFLEQSKWLAIAIKGDSVSVADF